MAIGSTSPVNVGPMQGGYTGGKPGTPTYAWSFVAPTWGPGATFLNPGNSSSQIVQMASVPADGSPRTQGVRVTVTDSGGAVSTQDATAQATNIS